jgi:hypothetical protein
MWRLIKILLFLSSLAAIGLVGYAYLGPLFTTDFAAPVQSVSKPVTLTLD